VLFLRRVAVGVLVCAVWVGATGCVRDEDLAEATFVAESDGTRARVWVPVDEPRSIGTYRAEVAWADGGSSSTQARRDGMICGVSLADLDGDNVPELVVMASSAGTGTYGAVDVYRRRDAALVCLHVKPLADDQRSGYQGHDLFSVDGGRLYRSYPVYLEGDSNASPSGGSATFWYSLPDSAWVRASGPGSASGRGAEKPN
jgi:hypothetical protein